MLLRNENCFISSWSLWVRNSERAQQEWLVLVPQFLELPSFWEDLKAQGEARDGGRSHSHTLLLPGLGRLGGWDC